MSLQKHTPGPWAVGKENACLVWSDDGLIQIADTSNSKSLRTEEKRANARLIAVAPDMAAVLKQLSQHFTGKWEKDTRDESEIHAHRSVAEARALAILERLKGRAA